MAGGELVLEGRVSVTGFVLGLAVVFIPVLTSVDVTGTGGKGILAIYLGVVNATLLVLYNGHIHKVAMRACLLGFTFGCGLLISFGQTTWSHFGWYMCALSFFHYSEYLMTAVMNPHSLTLDSFLLNHSVEYTVAAVCSWLEFILEKLLIPDLKQWRWLSLLGLLMVLSGEGLRKSAMMTAGSNFNHIVQNEKAQSHVLVTAGIYSWCRHPSYVGWFCWSIGTQVMLCNPLCLLGYTLVSWRFFRERVEEEELSLILFFGEAYLDYKRKVPTGLPFITGIQIES
ncbi:protein-S-isoprenylcysteine O-methyltransferase-like [Brienomyrus brachyistius]|uniref:protein-S-isoprenylcysteine O-methyltransferase-like n=1 Tax=Brienomyrus brachyistius TaxID=42636 RepID=UPI0020B3457F|nr:protein-S-isoprenylcysteine O-methyltransferase-like [Brienomyrus brachyistius]